MILPLAFIIKVVVIILQLMDYSGLKIFSLQYSWSDGGF